MIDKDALDLLQKTAVAAAMPTHLETFMPSIVLHRDGVVQNIEHLQPNRARYRTRYSTNTTADFLAYVKDGVERGNAPVFLQADRGFAEAFFNLGTPESPGHGDDTAKLQLSTTAPYAALLAIDGKSLSQRALADWLEDWRPMLCACNADDERTNNLSNALTAIRTITITANGENSHAISSLGAKRTALEEIEAKGKLELPTGFIATCAPFAGFNTLEFFLRLTVVPDNSAPKLSLRIIGLADLQEQIAKEFEAKVREGLPTSAKVYRGALSL